MWQNIYLVSTWSSRIAKYFIPFPSLPTILGLIVCTIFFNTFHRYSLSISYARPLGDSSFGAKYKHNKVSKIAICWNMCGKNFQIWGILCTIIVWKSSHKCWYQETKQLNFLALFCYNSLMRTSLCWFLKNALFKNYGLMIENWYFPTHFSTIYSRIHQETLYCCKILLITIIKSIIDRVMPYVVLKIFNFD